jgi:hypothetical protein
MYFLFAQRSGYLDYLQAQVDRERAVDGMLERAYKASMRRPIQGRGR